MPVIRPEPLTREAFAPFGTVIETEGADSFLINAGTTRRYHAIAAAEGTGTNPRIIINIFEGQPRAFPLPVDLMERHPYGSQAFYPLDGRPWLLMVAGDANDPSTYRAFAATGQQGVNYARDTWHHPLMALDEVSRFIVVDCRGEEKNLVEQDVKHLGLEIAYG